MIRVALVLLLACSAPRTEPVPVRAPADAAQAVADPPEPTEPAAECIFVPVISCHDGLPTRTAMQPSPFEWCARTAPGADSIMPSDAQFSAIETRKARATRPAACCYIQFTTRTCR